MGAMRDGGSRGVLDRLNKAGGALGWLNPNATSILFYSFQPYLVRKGVPSLMIAVNLRNPGTGLPKVCKIVALAATTKATEAHAPPDIKSCLVDSGSFLRHR